MSSALTHVTVVPTGIVSVAGANVKLSILTVVAAAATVPVLVAALSVSPAKAGALNPGAMPAAAA
jgi:hypothetical protein